MEGFVYVLTNNAFPDLVKIGRTMHDPRRRASELFTTGVPSPFQVAFCVWCDDTKLIEDAVHCYLDEFRFNQSREFFKLDLPSAVAAVATFAMSTHGLFAVPRHRVIPNDVYTLQNVSDMPEAVVQDMLQYIVNAATSDVMANAKRHYMEDRYCSAIDTEGDRDGR